jgi:hypothetical protein
MPYSDPILALFGSRHIERHRGRHDGPDTGHLDRQVNASFGSVNVGATMATTVSVSNTGNADLRIDSIALGGASVFEFSQSNTCATPLPSQATCTITVRFSPTASGAKSGAIIISSDDPDENLLTVSASGTGITPPNTGITGDTDGGGGCFIATAAYGSSLDPHVASLRKFRDEHLLTNETGRAFVAFYYRSSPPIAAFIAKHEPLRKFTRLLLTPVLYGIRYPNAALILVIAPACAWCLRQARREKWTDPNGRWSDFGQE